MPGTLTHSPADVIRALAIQLGLGAMPEYSSGVQTATWPIFRWNEPDRPDDSITVMDTAGRTGATTHQGVEVSEYHGIQVRVRSADGDEGFAKARAIAVAFDSVNHVKVTAGPSATARRYIVKSIVRTSDVIKAGPDVPQGKRQVFTVNFVASLRECG